MSTKNQNFRLEGGIFWCSHIEQSNSTASAPSWPVPTAGVELFRVISSINVRLDNLQVELVTFGPNSEPE